MVDSQHEYRAGAFDGLALVVGITRYQRVSGLPAVHDAEDVANLLQDPAKCGYPSVTVLSEEQATRRSILDGLDRVVDTATPKSVVFLYFSGHGGTSGSGQSAEGHLLAIDSDPDNLATAIVREELARRLQSLKARHVTVVLDCCHAAAIAQPKGARAAGIDMPAPAEALATKLAHGRGRVVIAASREDGFAYAQDGHRNSFFTRFLLEGLRGGARGDGGLIRVFDLYDYVASKLRAAQPPQVPVFKGDVEVSYPLALHRGGQAPPPKIEPTSDGCKYDAFVSYNRKASADRSWVEKVLVPRLEALGLRLCLEHRNFRLGVPRIDEMERAITGSRYTLAILTSAYHEGPFEEFQSTLAQHLAIGTRNPRFIPVYREDVKPRLRIDALKNAALEFTDDEFEGSIARLASQLHESPFAPPA
jgi:hypothetical protein